MDMFCIHGASKQNGRISHLATLPTEISLERYPLQAESEAFDSVYWVSWLYWGAQAVSGPMSKDGIKISHILTVSGGLSNLLQLPPLFLVDFNCCETRQEPTFARSFDCIITLFFLP